MKFFSFKIFIFLFLGLFFLQMNPVSCIAKTQNKTVGDILKNIEKKSKIRIKKSRSLLPQFTKTKTSRRRVNLRKIKPSRTKFYSPSGTTEAKLEEVTDQSIRHLYKIAKRMKKRSTRGEIWLRLAEAYVDKARIVDSQMQKIYDVQAIAYNRGQRKKRPRLNAKASRRYNKKAVQLYEWFLRDFPKDPKVDQALFFLGYNYFELGQKSKGQKYYLRLAKSFPKSSYVGESKFSLGEYFFEKENWKKALGFYKQIKRGSRIYNFSLYKRSWAWYKMGQQKLALKTLGRVIRLGQRAKSSGLNKESDHIIRLAGEAIRDLVLFYVEVGSAKGAQSYFNKLVGKEKADSLIINLVYYYRDKGHRSQARYLFKKLIYKDPNSKKSFDYQYEIVRMYNFSGGRNSFTKELLYWVNNFGPNSAWAEYNSADTQLISKNMKNMESVARNYVLRRHQTAQKTKVRSAQKKTELAYKFYLKSFKQSKNLEEIRFFYAELLFDMRKYTKAAKEYLWVSSRGKQGKYYKKSLLNSLLAFEKGLPRISAIKRRSKGTKEPLTIDKKFIDFTKVATHYFKVFPGSKNKLPVEYRIASAYYYYNHYEKALPRFFSIVKNNPRSKFAEYSANLILDIYNIQKNYEGLDKAAAQLLSIPGLRNTSVRKQIQAIQSRSQFKKIKNIESSQNYEKAGKAYEQYARTNSKSKLGTVALFNAAVTYSKANLKADAFRAYRALLAKNPRSKKMKRQATQFLALEYENLGNYPLSVRYYEKFYSYAKGSRKSIDFIYNAAVIRHGLGQYSLALKNYNIYYEKSKRKDRREVLFLMAQAWEGKRNYKKAIYFYNKYTKGKTKNRSQIMKALYHIARLNKKIGNLKTSYRWHKKIVATYRSFSKKGHSVGASYAAESRLKLIKRKEYKNFISVTIPRNQKKQARALKKKIRLIERLKTSLASVIRYNDAYQIVAALSLQGQALQNMMRSIARAPLPKGLSSKDLKIYKEGIQKIIEPFREQAINIYKTAVKKAESLGVYSAELLQARNQLYLLTGLGKQNLGQRSLLLNSLEYMGSKPYKTSASLRTLYGKLSKDPKNLKDLNSLAIYYIEKKKYRMAQIIFDRILRGHSRSYAVLNNIAVNYLLKGDLRKGVSGLRDAIKLGQFSESASSNLGSIELKYRNYDQALVLLEDSYKTLDSDFSLGRSEIALAQNYALALWGTGKIKESKKIFKRIISQSKVNVTLMLNYVIILSESKKNRGEALKYIRRIKILSHNRSLLRNLKILEAKLR